MTLQMRPDPKLIRAPIALVWLYEGLWCKLLGGVAPARGGDCSDTLHWFRSSQGGAHLAGSGRMRHRSVGLVWAANAPGGPCADCAALGDERGWNDLGEAPDSRPRGHDRAELGFPDFDLDCSGG